MKKKFSLWLNIATICLCICAIAIGVYAAQSATLNVTGSVGFKAHGVEYTATAMAKNYATDKEGDEFKSALTSVTDTEGTHANETLSLKPMYFSDKSGEVQDIELQITIKNTSKFDITITPLEASCTGVDISKPEATSAIKETGTATLIYILSLKTNSSGDYDDITANTLSIEIKLERDTTAYKTDTNGNQIAVHKFDDSDKTIWNKTVGSTSASFSTYGYTEDSPCYATYFPYYITMGKVGDEDIKWLIVGTNNNGTVTALTQEDKAILEKGKLLADTTYVALSAECITTQVFLSSSNYSGPNSSYVYVNTKSSSGVNANDYYESDIRDYLKSTEDSGFAKTYSLKSPTIIVEERKVEELYADMPLLNAPGSGKITGKTAVTGADKFWLLSVTEFNVLFKDNINSSSASASITTDNNSKTASWWLRSPDHENSHRINYVGDSGFLYDGISGKICSSTAMAVRPAFQF